MGVHIGEGGDAAIDEGKKGHHGLQPSQSGETVDDDYVQRIGNNKQIRFHFGEYDAKCIVTKKKKIVFSQDKNEPFQLSLIPNKKRKEKKEQYKIVCIKGDHANLFWSFDYKNSDGFVLCGNKDEKEKNRHAIFQFSKHRLDADI